MIYITDSTYIANKVPLMLRNPKKKEKNDENSECDGTGVVSLCASFINKCQDIL